MARNRKYQTAAVRFGPALKAFGMCLLLGGSGVGYVWQKTQINALGEQLKQSEIRFDKLRRHNEGLAQALALLQSPTELDARVKQMNLGLIAPQPDQIVRLLETSPNTTARSAERLYAEQKFGH